MKAAMRSFGNVSGLTIRPLGLDTGLGGPTRSGHVTGQSISRSGTTLRIRPQPGDYPGDSGNSVAWDDPNWVAVNIREGVSIFGLVGTLAPGKKFASGSGTVGANNIISVNGLGFRPKIIIAETSHNYLGSGNYMHFRKTYAPSQINSNLSSKTLMYYPHVNDEDGFHTGPWTITDDGFSTKICEHQNEGSPFYWMAFE